MWSHFIVIALNQSSFTPTGLVGFFLIYSQCVEVKELSFKAMSVVKIIFYVNMYNPWSPIVPIFRFSSSHNRLKAAFRRRTSVAWPYERYRQPGARRHEAWWGQCDCGWAPGTRLVEIILFFYLLLRENNGRCFRCIYILTWIVSSYSKEWSWLLMKYTVCLSQQGIYR